MNGFYKYENNNLLHAPNFVLDLNYELRVESKDEYNYPIDGWYYFNSKEDAELFFGIIQVETNNIDSEFIIGGGINGN